MNADILNLFVLLDVEFLIVGFDGDFLSWKCCSNWSQTCCKLSVCRYVVTIKKRISVENCIVAKGSGTFLLITKFI